MICMSRQTALWLLLLIVITGVGLRSYQLTTRSLWFDEVFSWRLIQFPWGEMITRAAADVHPPLYYILLKSWSVVFGSSLLALRSFSIVGAGLTIAAGYLFSASAFKNRSAGLFAAWLLALSGWQIAFAWEARMYTFGMALAFFSSWLVLRAVRRPNLMNWLFYAGAAAAFTYIHYFAFFTIAAQLLFVAGYIVASTRGRIGEMLQWRLTWYALLAIVVMFGLYSPWLPTFLKQNAQVQAAYWVPPIGGWSIPDTFYRMWLPTSGIPAHHGLGIIIAGLPIILTIIGWLLLVIVPRLPQDSRWLTAFLGIIPFLLAITISFVGHSLYQDRFLVFAHLFMVAALAGLVMSSKRPPVRATLVTLITFWFAATAVHYWQELDIIHKPGAHAAARAVYTTRQTNEPVVVTSPFVFFAIDHYSKEEYGADQPKLLSANGELAHFAGGPILTQQDVISPDIFTSTTSSTLWLVDTTGFGSTEIPLPASWHVAERGTFPEVYGYQGDVIVRKLQRVL